MTEPYFPAPGSRPTTEPYRTVAVQIAALAVALALVHALVWAFSGRGTAFGLFLLVVVPVGLVWILVHRVRCLARALRGASDTDSS